MQLGKRVALGAAALLTAAGGVAAVAAPASAAQSPMTVAPAAAHPNTPVRGYGKVASKINLNVRARPTTASKVVGTVKPGEVISLSCKVWGQNVDGNALWYKLSGPSGNSSWVAARFVRNLDPIPYC